MTTTPDGMSGMDFWATARIVVRRWYAVLPALVVCVAGVAQIYTSLPATYLSRSVLLVTSPTAGGTQYGNGFQPDLTNPLLNSGNGLDLTGTVLIQAMRTSSFATTVQLPDDGSTVLTVNNGTDNPELLISGPFVYVEVESDDPVASQAITQRSVAEAHSELRRQQAALGAPLSTYVTLTEIVPPTTPEPLRGDRLRAAGAALALGLILSLAAGFACESLLLARKSRLVERTVSGPRRSRKAGEAESAQGGHGGKDLPVVVSAAREEVDSNAPHRTIAAASEH